jgi:hypothetical protein
MFACDDTSSSVDGSANADGSSSSDATARMDATGGGDAVVSGDANVSTDAAAPIDGGADADGAVGTDGGTQDSVSVPITAAGGGTVTLGDVTLQIPAGALRADTTITITRRAPDVDAPDPTSISGSVVYDFGPADLVFSTPATLTLPVIGTPPQDSTVVISWHFVPSSPWQDLATTVNAARATAPVEHFTEFAVRFLVAAAPEPGSSTGEFTVCVNGTCNAACTGVRPAGAGNCMVFASNRYSMSIFAAACGNDAVAVHFNGGVPTDGTHEIVAANDFTAGRAVLSYTGAPGGQTRFATSGVVTSVLNSGAVSASFTDVVLPDGVTVSGTITCH